MKKRDGLHPNYTKLKPKLNKAFALMRKKGLIAKQNFSCCGSCGHYELSQELNNDNTKKGYVFYNMQSMDHFKQRGKSYLAYSSNIDDDAARESTGKEICGALEQAGVPYTFDEGMIDIGENDSIDVNNAMQHLIMNAMSIAVLYAFPKDGDIKDIKKLVKHHMAIDDIRRMIDRSVEQHFTYDAKWTNTKGFQPLGSCMLSWLQEYKPEVAAKVQASEANPSDWPNFLKHPNAVDFLVFLMENWEE